MDASLLPVHMFRYQINHLRDTKRHDGIEQDGFPVLTYIIISHFLPAQNQEQYYNQNNDSQLPAQADHHDLQRDHQQDRIQVVEDRQYLYLLIYPRGF